MSVHEDLIGFLAAPRFVRRPPLTGMDFLHQRALPRFEDMPRPRQRLKAQDLISLLKREKNRQRLALQPRVKVTVSVFAPNGRQAVWLYM
jgi:hypothetical protein